MRWLGKKSTETSSGKQPIAITPTEKFTTSGTNDTTLSNSDTDSDSDDESDLIKDESTSSESISIHTINYYLTKIGIPTDVEVATPDNFTYQLGTKTIIIQHLDNDTNPWKTTCTDTNNPDIVPFEAIAPTAPQLLRALYRFLRHETHSAYDAHTTSADCI